MALVVIDDFTSSDEHSLLVNRLSGDVWRYGWAKPERLGHPPVWHVFMAGANRYRGGFCQLELKLSPSWSILYPVWERLQKKFTGGGGLLGVYGNAHTQGQESYVHRDVAFEETSVTAILFTTSHWNASWAGETVFYSDASLEIERAVLPKPRRLIIFHGNTLHSVRSPSVSARALRTSIVFKTTFPSFKE